MLPFPAKSGHNVSLDSKAKMPYIVSAIKASPSMTQLTLTSKGQLTLRRNVLKHLGVEPGQKIEVELLPNGRAEIKLARPAASIDGFIGLLKGRSRKVLTIEEMNEAAAAGWAKAHERRR